MSDTPGDVSNEPILWHQGQAYSRQSAAEALAAFDADVTKVKAAIRGDTAMQQERRDLWMLSRGYQPGGVPAMPSDAGGVHEQMTEREAQIEEARLGVWQNHIRMNPALLPTYVDGSQGYSRCNGPNARRFW